ncbi:MAG: ABC transporter permease subunit [Desulfarculaceae bacterium]|nr:ABC transporter permease subunit [Desulfarculaceae bacterium]MCF8071529.1 ABC transporter permease subunit [Desulfarculaceae bacterium]MCF8102344.1 ABC transporter permease subunit [Desulfarculaceae bacterium]MCF8114808.1 ABC transporter permease subunit [Desulfarculaceae bacterium]
MIRGLGRLNTSLILGGGLVALLLLVALAGPWLAPHDPLKINLAARLAPPSPDYPLGADPLGRCVLSRLLYGCRTSLAVGLMVSAGVMLLGVALGLAAGLGGRYSDFWLMRLVDIVLAFPSLVLTLAVIGLLGPSLPAAAVALCLSWWPVYARLVRGLVLSAREREFVLAARLVGTSGLALVRRHILPSVLPPIMVMASLETGTMVLVLAGLSFLGLGAQPPLPEWGAMLNEARSYIYTAPHLLLAPGLAIFLTVLGFNLLGEGLRDALRVKKAVS